MHGLLHGSAGAGVPDAWLQNVRPSRAAPRLPPRALRDVFAHALLPFFAASPLAGLLTLAAPAAAAESKARDAAASAAPSSSGSSSPSSSSSSSSAPGKARRELSPSATQLSGAQLCELAYAYFAAHRVVVLGGQGPWEELQGLEALDLQEMVWVASIEVRAVAACGPACGPACLWACLPAGLPVRERASSGGRAGPSARTHAVRTTRRMKARI